MAPGSPIPPGLPTAEEFVRALALRGITFLVRGDDGTKGRLWLQPAKAYRTLTDTERAVIRHRRDELKAMVREGRMPQPTVQEAIDETADTVPSRPSKPKEPDPIMWTSDYSRRITDADVQAAGIPSGVPKRQAYQQARSWLDEQERKQRSKQFVPLHMFGR